MLTGISSNSASSGLTTYFQQRDTELKQLGQDLKSGNVSGAEQEYSDIQTLAKNGPLSNGNAFIVPQRQQDFAAIGQALQSGNLSGAQQAFAYLQGTAHPGQTEASQPPATGVLTPSSGAAQSGSGSTSSSGGPEIVLNLGTLTPGEQISIGLNNNNSGGEQISIGVASQQNQSPEQINLNLNSNQQIVLNLLNGTATNSAGSSSNSSFSVTA
jgi:hypothetical protein